MVGCWRVRGRALVLCLGAAAHSCGGDAPSCCGAVRVGAGARLLTCRCLAMRGGGRVPLSGEDLGWGGAVDASGRGDVAAARWQGSSSSQELEREVYHFAEAKQMRAVHLDGLGGLGSGWGGASEAHEPSSEDARSGTAAMPREPQKLRKGGLQRDTGVHTGDGANSLRRGKYADAPDEEIAFCMQLDSVARERRGEGSKQRHARARQQRIHETGSLKKKPLGSRRDRQGVTVSATRTADVELMSVCVELLKETASSPLSGDLASIYGRKWYKTPAGIAYLEKQRRLEEFASLNQGNRLFAHEWGCLPEELRRARCIARELRAAHFPELPPVSDSTNDSSQEGEGVAEAGFATAAGAEPSAMLHASFVPRVLSDMAAGLEHQMKGSRARESAARQAEARSALMSQPDPARRLSISDTAQLESGGAVEAEKGQRVQREIQKHVALRDAIHELEQHQDDDPEDLLRLWLRRVEEGEGGEGVRRPEGVEQGMLSGSGDETSES